MSLSSFELTRIRLAATQAHQYELESALEDHPEATELEVDIASIKKLRANLEEQLRAQALTCR